MNSNPTQYDVSVVGGGAIGAALACQLGQAGLRVALIDAREPQATVPPRVSALNAASRKLLESLGVWSGLLLDAQMPPQPYDNMRVWDALGWGEIHFDAAQSGCQSLGWIVSDFHLRRALWQCATQIPTLDLICPARLMGYATSLESLRVDLDTHSIETRLIVGADGARSKLREIAGITTRDWDYHQHALVTTVIPELSHQQTAWQRFLPTGPLALLPLADGRCSIVWSLTTALVADHLAVDLTAFSERLTEASGGCLGHLQATDQPVAFPLRALSASDYVQRRLALIGDAAHVVHPLAGQGANMGFVDVADLASRVIDAHRAGRDPGGSRVLRAYQRCRKTENLQTIIALDGLARLFGNSIKPLSLLRNFGLNWVDSSALLKFWLSRQATGSGTASAATKLQRINYTAD